MRVLTVVSVAAALLPALVVADSSLRLLHRIYHPSLASEPFTDRGRLLLSGSGPLPHASLVSADAFEADLSAFAAAAQNVEYDPDLTLYQLALERPGDTEHTQWHVSAVKACHALSSVAETLTVHISADGSPFALDYFVAPVPHNGACPKARRPVSASPLSAASRPDASGVGEPARALAFAGLTNSTVHVRAPTVPPLPQLHTPPPLTTDGQPLQAPQEKSFVQKYWVYGVVALIALSLAPGGDDGQAGGR